MLYRFQHYNIAIFYFLDGFCYACPVYGSISYSKMTILGSMVVAYVDVDNLFRELVNELLNLMVYVGVPDIQRQSYVLVEFAVEA